MGLSFVPSPVGRMSWRRSCPLRPRTCCSPPAMSIPPTAPRRWYPDTDGTIYNFAGLYLPAAPTRKFLVYRSAGKAESNTWIRLLQYGNVLEAYNASKSWDGGISSITDGNASFNLRGQTTAGAAVEIADASHYTNQNSAMDAAWIEPGFSGSIFARPPSPRRRSMRQNRKSP